MGKTLDVTHRHACEESRGLPEKINMYCESQRFVSRHQRAFLPLYTGWGASNGPPEHTANRMRWLLLFLLDNRNVLLCLVVSSFTKTLLSCTGYIRRKGGDLPSVKYSEGCRNEVSRPVLMYHPSNCFKWLTKTTKDPTRQSTSRQGIEAGPPEW
jgi:hypothetical protein